MYINNLGHLTKMAAMPIYGKNPSKIFFSETNRLISRKLCVKHRWLKYSNVYINHDPVMTLTKFMANGQNIEDSEKRKWPRASSAPALELNTIIFKHVYWYMQQISGERLQDHWSSGSSYISFDALAFVFMFVAFTVTFYLMHWHLPLCFLLLQVNLIITLSLGSMETDRVIGEPCYNEVIYNRHKAK